jgi:hypothetical protein
MLEPTARLLKVNADDVELLDRAVWPQIGLAKIDVAEGRLAQGLARYKACLRDLDRLWSQFPNNRLVLGERIRVNVLVAAALRKAGRADWTSYRDRAEMLLYGGEAEGAGKRTPPPGLERQHEMFLRLEKGDWK